MNNFSLSHWGVIALTLGLVFWPLLRRILRAIRRPRESDLDVLDRLAPRAPARSTPAVREQTSSVHQHPQQAAQQAAPPLLWKRVALTAAYVPCHAILLAAWSSVRPDLVRTATASAPQNQQTVAIALTVLSLGVYVILFYPYFAVWRHRTGQR